MLPADLNVVRVQRLTRFLDVTREPERSEGGHSQEIVPGLKAPTNGWLISPDLNEVRVQRLTLARNVSANPNEVRVQSCKGTFLCWKGEERNKLERMRFHPSALFSSI